MAPQTASSFVLTDEPVSQEKCSTVLYVVERDKGFWRGERERKNIHTLSCSWAVLVRSEQVRKTDGGRGGGGTDVPSGEVDGVGEWREGREVGRKEKV